MRFSNLPKDVKNIVCGFAYDQNWEKTASSLRICLETKKLHISPVFLRLQMWSWTYLAFIPSPLYVFEPIHNFTGRWADMVDWHAVNELLFRLDYRKSIVRIAGCRKDWYKKFTTNWLNIRLFDSFYRILLHSGFNCFKPTYMHQGANCLGTGPMLSARWLLEDWTVRS